MAEKKRKKKMDPAEMHRKVQDSVQFLPYEIAKMEKEGRRGRAFVLRYISMPISKLINKLMTTTRYKGTEGAKLKQSEQMKRHLDQRKQAMQYVQGELAKKQKQAQKRTKPR